MIAFAEAVEILRRTPGTLRSLLGGLSEAWTGATPSPEVWTPRQVVGHLLHGERTDWVPRTRIILEHGAARPFDPFDREGFRAIASLSLPEALDAFERERAENLTELDRLNVAGSLDARGAHPEFGPVALGEMIATWAVHDLAHTGQIVEVMAKRWRDEVGPWRRFLPIVDRPHEPSD